MFVTTGEVPRLPRALSSSLHRSATRYAQGMPTREQEDLFRRGIDLFNREEFFECHEVLEELWTHTRQPERWFLQSLIHFAVGFYHHRRGNSIGAVRQLNKGIKKIQGYLPAWGGLETAAIEAEARRCLALVEAGKRIESFPKIEPFGPYVPGPEPAAASRLS